MDDTKVTTSHGIDVLVILIGDDDDIAVEFLILEAITHISLSIASLVEGDHSVELRKRMSLRRKTGGSGVLEQEFLNTFADVLKAELGLVHLVTRSDKDNGIIFSDVMCLSEVISSPLNTFFHIVSEMVLGAQK